MRFIRLTRHDGQPLLVDADKIAVILPFETFASVTVDGQTIDVREFAEDIIAKIDKEAT